MEQSTKFLGGISYIVLIVFGILGATSSPFLEIISLIAVVCLLVAFYRAGGELGAAEVKRDMTIAIVTYIIASILLAFFAGTAGVIGWILAIIGWVLLLVAASSWYKASRALTEAGGGSLFKWGGLLILIALIVTVILNIIGLLAGGGSLILVEIAGIVQAIGFILQCIAFFMAPRKALA